MIGKSEEEVYTRSLELQKFRRRLKITKENKPVSYTHLTLPTILRV